jgi:hypothetical protein
MARDFDNFPTYDPVIKPGTSSLSNIWGDFLATFVETLTGYLSQNGIFVPRLTTDQRDQLQNVINGQLIYNTTLNKFQGYENNSWQNLI